MEAVTAHAFRMQVLRDGIMIRSRAVVSVEGRIEAGNLGEFREHRENRADRRQIVRLMEWRKGYVAFKPGEYLLVYENRFGVLRAAMHHAVTHRAWQYTLLFPQSCTG